MNNKKEEPKHLQVMTDELKALIKEKRPKLSDTSIKTYASILKNLWFTAFDDLKFNPLRFDDTKRILQTLSDVDRRTRKTMLSALVVVTDNKIYRDLMIDDINDYNIEIGKQEKNDKQKESWVDNEDIKNIFSELEKESKYIYKKKNKSDRDLQDIQQFIILSLLGGVFIPPRRSKDYVDFKILGIDKNKDNYIENNKLFFNSYKTAKFYGQQSIEIPKELNNILKKWIKINPTEYLFFDSNKNKLSNVKLNQRLNKIFEGKKVGVNQLRKTHLTDKYKDVIELNKDIDDTFKKMGSSRSQFLTYVKKDENNLKK